VKTKIPAATIGLLSQILPNHYTHNGLNSLFQTASAPANIPEGSKPSKVTTWMRAINAECPDPLTVLGALLEDFMEKELLPYGLDPKNDEERARKLKEDQEKILQTLAKDGLSYARGGHVTKGGTFPTLSLQENVSKRGLAAVDLEIKRALENVESDPGAAAHNAGSVLEASFKVYLDHYGIEYKHNSDMPTLWQKVVEHIGIRPKELENKNLKKIASGLYSIVEGTMNLRNPEAHGKSESEFKQGTLHPRHARLAIHAAHTVSAYILELLEERKL